MYFPLVEGDSAHCLAELAELAELVRETGLSMRHGMTTQTYLRFLGIMISYLTLLSS